jgi:metal-responsive CopG/Arc/MetJ family transcriptional regulator
MSMCIHLEPGVWYMNIVKRVHVNLDAEMIRRLDAKAKLEGSNRTELISLAIEKLLSDNAADEGVDSTARLLRKLLEDVTGPQINRLAKMIAKTTKAAATTMYMQTILLDQNEKVDAIASFKDSTTKAVEYLNTRE